MAGTSLTNYGEQQILKALFQGAALGAPATWYVGLVTALEDDTGTATTNNPTELSTSGTGYAGRQAVAANSTNFGNIAASGTATQIASQIAESFGTATGSAWTLAGVALWDASTAGNCWLCDALSGAPVTVPVGSTFSLPAGNLTDKID